jgi:hypothetical protein
MKNASVKIAREVITRPKSFSNGSEKYYFFGVFGKQISSIHFLSSLIDFNYFLLFRPRGFSCVTTSGICSSNHRNCKI